MGSSGRREKYRTFDTHAQSQLATNEREYEGKKGRNDGRLARVLLPSAKRNNVDCATNFSSGLFFSFSLSSAFAFACHGTTSWSGYRRWWSYRKRHCEKFQLMHLHIIFTYFSLVFLYWCLATSKRTKNETKILYEFFGRWFSDKAENKTK